MTDVTANTTTTVRSGALAGLPDRPGEPAVDEGVTDGRRGDGSRGGERRGGDAPGADLAGGDLRALRRAWVAGAAPVAVLFAWLLMAGRWAPLQRQFFDDFFDTQARALLDGHWDVPRGSVGFEGFLIGGRTYIYFGPFPSLLRVPLFLVTDRFDGRLTTVSMLLALLVLGVAGHRLNVAIRELVRGAAPVTRTERVVTCLLAVAVLGGIPLWLASTAAVFHEAILWGLAFTLAALSSLVRWMRRPTGRGLAAAAALTAAAVGSRQPLGLGLLSGLALVALVVVVTRAAARRTGRPPSLLRGVPLAGVAAIGIVGFLACAVPNMVKFGNPVGPPIDRHIASMVLEDRQEFLEASGGKYFGTDYVATTALQYARPDAIAFRGDFPWVDFPPEGPRVVGDVPFDSLEWSSSVPVTMPALVVAAVPGVVWLVRSLRRRDGSEALLALWIGTGVAAAGALTIAYIGPRYLGDLAPIVIVPGLVGAHVLLGWSPDRAAARRVAGAGLVGLVAFGLWVNLGLGIQYQRARGFNVPEQWRAELAQWRADLPGSRRSVVEVDAGARSLPRAADGTLAVVGDCLGMYERVGDRWWGVSRGPGVGVHDIRVDLDALDELDLGTRAPLATVGTGGDRVVVALRRHPDGRVRAETWRPGTGAWSPGWGAVDAQGEVTVRVVTDPRVPEGFVSLGRADLDAQVSRDPAAPVEVGRVVDGAGVPGVLPAYPGHIGAAAFDRTLCRDATGVG